MKIEIFRAVAFSALSFLVFGCESSDKEIFSRNIQIESVPTGAPIIIDGLQMGKTPIGVGVETTEDGHFVRRTTITAIPQSDKLYTQVITFPAYASDSGEKSEVPEKITFNMEKSPTESDSITIDGESTF